jgi:hypothetical protein
VYRAGQPRPIRALHAVWGWGGGAVHNTTDTATMAWSAGSLIMPYTIAPNFTYLRTVVPS